MSFSVAELRAQFPLLNKQVDGKPLVYLDNAATTQKPQVVIDALVEFYTECNANVHRGAHRLSDEATRRYEKARDQVAAFVGASHREEVIWTTGTTESINLVAHGAGQLLKTGDEVVVTELEHHANLVTWQQACKRSGATLRVVPIFDSGELDVEAFKQTLNENTRLVAMPHVSNALGTLNPIKELTALAKQVGAWVLIDGAQGIAHGGVDVNEIGCDFYAFSGHKIFGPTGIGVLWGRKEVLENWPVWLVGGEMIHDVTYTDATWGALPNRLEAGTPNIAGAIGLGCAVDWFSNLDMVAVQQHEADLIQYAMSQGEAFEGLRLIGTAPNKVGVMSFLLDGSHPADVGFILDKQGEVYHVDFKPRQSAEARALFERAIGQVLDSGEHYQETMNAPSFENTWLKFSFTPVFTPARDIVAIDITSIDVTEVIQLRESLTAKQESDRLRAENDRLLKQFELASTAAKFAVYKHDLLTNQVEMSDWGYELYGFDRSTQPVIGFDDLISFYSPEMQARFKAGIDEAIATGKPVELSASLTQGEKVTHLLGSIYVQIEDGAPRYILGAFKDITDLQASREALEQAFQTAHESQRELELATESGQVGLFAINLTSGRMTQNRQHQNLLALPMNLDLRSLREQLFERVLEADHEKLTDFFDQINDPAMTRVCDEFRVMLPIRGVRHYRVLLSKYIEFNGETAIRGSVIDMSDLRKTEQRLRDEVAKQEQLFAIIGHELRTPASALKMLLEDQNISELEPHGGVIAETADHLLRVLDDMRIVTRDRVVH
jgi:cysteine desulfurase/selenocysteine lyase